MISFVLPGMIAALLMVLQLHKYAVRELVTNYYVAFCFAFPCSFRFLVSLITEWAPHWAPVCLWYSFLVQLFCTSGSTRDRSGPSVPIFRLLLPLAFVAEGVSSRSHLLDLNGAELLLLSFVLAAMKMKILSSPIFFLSWASQVLMLATTNPHPVMQYCQFMLALTSLYACETAASRGTVVGAARAKLA